VARASVLEAKGNERSFWQREEWLGELLNENTSYTAEATTTGFKVSVHPKRFLVSFLSFHPLAFPHRVHRSFFICV